MACTAWLYILADPRYFLTLRVSVPNAVTFAQRCAFKIGFSTFASSTHLFTTASDKLVTRPGNLRNCYPLGSIHWPPSMRNVLEMVMPAEQLDWLSTFPLGIGCA